MRNYDPIAESTKLGIEVRLDSLPFGHSWWIPELRTIAVDESIPDRYRDVWVAHQIAHAMIDPTGDFAGVDNEVDAAFLTARRAITLGDLADAARHDSNPHDIANALDTTPELVLVRANNLSPGERALIGNVIEEIAWEHLDLTAGHECVQCHTRELRLAGKEPAVFRWTMDRIRAT